MNNEYKMIDLLKFIFSFFIIAMHCEPFGGTWGFVVKAGPTRVAVPFYFAAAGFFFAKKLKLDGSDGQILKKYIFRLTRLYFVWSVLYLPFVIRQFIIKGYTPLQCIMSYIRKIFFVGTFTQLWYLPALITAIIIAYCLFVKLKTSLKVIAVFAGIMFIVGIFGEAYFGVLNSDGMLYKIYSLYGSVFSRTRNGFFFGLIYVVMGFAFARCGVKIGNRKSAVLTVIFAGLATIEAFWLIPYNIKQSYGMYTMLVPCVFFLFSWAENTDIKISGDIAKKLRNMSVLIYVSHCWFLEILNIIEYKTGQIM